MKNISVWIDWSKSFVDKNGSFYAGTTEEQKDNAVRMSEGADLFIYLCDLHSRNSSEFISNGGIYSVHNINKKDQYDLFKLGVKKRQTVSPQLTEKLYDLVEDKKSGLIVPRHVFFQDYNGEKDPQPAFSFEDVEETFGIKKLKAQEFLDGGIEYIVNAKHMFNGAGLQSTEWMGEVQGVPSMEMNAFTLLKQKYGQGEGLVFNLTGVVTLICGYQSGSNIKQIFPKADVNLIADASTHLIYSPLGIADLDTANLIAKKMCQQVGINYISTNEYLGGR